MPNIFKETLGDTPRETLNLRLFAAVICFGLLGSARGIDEGLITGIVQQKQFRVKYGLESSDLSPGERADRVGNITAMVQIGSIVGALLAFLVTDRIGRVWATRQLCTVWAVGIAIFLTANGRLGQVYAGRFIAGMGIGQTPVVGPLYIAEISPRTIRGLCLCAFSASVYLGVTIAYFATWGGRLHLNFDDEIQWRLPASIHIMMAGTILLFTFIAKESPRFLARMDKKDEALRNMTYIRKLPSDHSYVQSEMNDIYDQLRREREATAGVRWFGSLKELFGAPSNRYRIMIGLTSQFLSQWSGATSITIYAPRFFAMLGTDDETQLFFESAIFGVVKLVSSLICALFLVDYLGRKRALGYGISLQLITILYVAIYLVVAPVREGVELEGDSRRAATGAIAAIYLTGAGWALGWNSIQYLINAEIFPLQVRALGTSMVICTHFANQYGCAKALPTMLLPTALKPHGTFFFFSGTTLVGLVWVWFFLPETSGKSLEAMDELFSLPWHVIGRKGAALTSSVPQSPQTAQSETDTSDDMEKGSNKEPEIATVVK